MLGCHVSSPDLLRDSDTSFLLQTVRRRQAPLSWFAGDWPLQNHFYRPMATLAFEMDNRLYGDRAAGYGWTNAALCALCVLLLFWFVRELTDRPLVAGSCTVLFAAWNLDLGYWPAQAACWLAAVALVGGAIRNGLNLRAWVLAPLGLLFLSRELLGETTLYNRMIGWLPGRTASVMSVFALIAFAAYARYERLGAERLPAPDPTPLDPPATRSAVQSEPRREAAGWALLSVLGVAGALASYEQAVMLPAALLGIALTLRFRRYRVRFGWQGAYWGLLVGYLALRHAVVPSAPSSYQLQQFRDGPGVRLALEGYFLPALAGLESFGDTLTSGWLILFTAAPYLYVLEWATDVAAFLIARRDFVLPLAGWALSGIVYLPMAWVKPFDHYQYLPMALRTLLVVGLAGPVGRQIVSAWSRPARQAPPRPAPAPGSLPRR